MRLAHKAVHSLGRNPVGAAAAIIGVMTSAAWIPACGGSSPSGANSDDGGVRDTTADGAVDGATRGTSNALCNDDFCWMLPKPQGADLHGITATSEGSVWAVGGGGALLHRDGAQWIARAAPRPKTLRGVWAAADDDVWAVGDDGFIVHFDGRAFTVVPSGTTHTLYGVWGASRDHIWAVGNRGDLLFYDGRSWTAQKNADGAEMHAVWGSGPNDVWAVGGTLNTGTKAHWNGTAWTIQTSGLGGAGYYAVGGTSVNDVWAAGMYGTIAHFDGKTWSERSFVTNNAYTGLQALAPDDVLAVAADGTSHWDGQKWAKADATAGLNAMAAAPGSKVIWLAGAGGAVRRSDARDYEITPMGLGEGATTEERVWVHDDRDVYVVDHAHDILHFDGTEWRAMAPAFGGDDRTSVLGGTADGKVLAATRDVSATKTKVNLYDGNEWKPLPDLKFPINLKLTGTSPNDVWAAGAGQAAHFDGTKWTIQSYEATGDVSPTGAAFFALDSQTAWVVGRDRQRAYVGTYDGNQWKASTIPNGDNTELHSVWASAPNDVWASGVFTDTSRPKNEGGYTIFPTRPVIYHYDGSQWVAQAVPEPLAKATYHSTRHAWLAGTSQKRIWLVLEDQPLFTGDMNLPGNSYSWDGQTWTERPCPAGPIGGVWLTASSTWVFNASAASSPGQIGGGLLRTR